MSERSFLIDTNVLIGLEDSKPVDAEFAEMQRRCSASGVRLYVSYVSLADIERDADSRRRVITLSKLEKFEQLRDYDVPPKDVLESRFGRIRHENDQVDAALLFTVAENIADFLITQDARIHRRADLAGLGDRVFTVEDAVAWLRQTYDPTEVRLPHLYKKQCYQLRRDDSIFETLREDYPEFDEWFLVKCVKGKRWCWVVDVADEVAGILIPKEETPADTNASFKGNRILKICTFKVRDEYRGEKFGELLLKQVLWHAQVNRYDVVYVTAFPEKQEFLVATLSKFGFVQTLSRENGEIILEKHMGSGPVTDSSSDVLSLDRRNYPRFVDDERISVYCAPIQPDYHLKLFPEKFESVMPRLFSLTRMFGKEERLPGNTISKVYLCRANVKSIGPGDLLLFYLSKGREHAHSQSITTVGIVESVQETTSFDELQRLTAKRSVFSRHELLGMLEASEMPLRIIEFLLIGHLDKPYTRDELLRTGVLSASPQSITSIPMERYSRLKLHERLGY